MKIFRFFKIWLIASTLISFILALVFFLELLFYGSGYMLIPLFFLSPWIPGPILFSLYKDIKKVPTEISIFDDRLVFHYITGLYDRNVTMFWGDIVELSPFDKVRDNRNQTVILPMLEKRDMERIMLTARRPENLDLHSIWEVRNIDEAVQRAAQLPEEQVCISRKAWKRTLYFAVLWFFFAFLLYAGVNKIFRNAYLDDDEYLEIAIGLAVFSFPMLVLSTFGLFRQIRKREIRIDERGVRYLYRRSVRYNIRWDQLETVSIYKSNNTIIMVLQMKGGKKRKISSDEFDAAEIRSAFVVMKRYCSYYGIGIDNHLGW
jgi:hypothetical protein